MRNEFIDAVEANQGAFGVELSPRVVERLADHYEIVQEHNTLLHLVAPCSAEEFAVRHILESLLLLRFLPADTRFADVGSGAGLPSIPCLIARDDLAAVLIENKVKKARYLEDALDRLDLVDRAVVVNKQFTEVRESPFDVVTCRALDNFTEKLQKLLKWSTGTKRILFGGPSIGAELERLKIPATKELIPLSEQRYIYLVGHEKDAAMIA